MDVISFIVAYFLTGIILARIVFPWLVVYYLRKHQRKQKISEEMYDQYSEDRHESIEENEKHTSFGYKLKSLLMLYLLWPYELPKRTVRILNYELGVLSAYKEDEENESIFKEKGNEDL